VGTFLSHGHTLAKSVDRYCCSALIDSEQRIVSGDKITDLGHQFNKTAGVPS
jgi:hypothetical protein